jgi:hypothetical protein
MWKSEPIILPDDMDAECIALCEAMNRYDGIMTTGSCCGHDLGHGIQPFRVFFHAESLESLPLLLYGVDACHSGVRGWKVVARTDCAASPTSFLLEGPIGDYKGAERIAEVLNQLVSEKV